MMMAMMTVLSARKEAHGSVTVANSPRSVKHPKRAIASQFEILQDVISSSKQGRQM
jgi:hypothetical protein